MVANGRVFLRHHPTAQPSGPTPASMRWYKASWSDQIRVSLKENTTPILVRQRPSAVPFRLLCIQWGSSNKPLSLSCKPQVSGHLYKLRRVRLDLDFSAKGLSSASSSSLAFASTTASLSSWRVWRVREVNLRMKPGDLSL